MTGILQVGMGVWGLDWVKVLQGDERVGLLACVDVSAAALEAAQRTLELPKVRFFTDFERALLDVKARYRRPAGARPAGFGGAYARQARPHRKALRPHGRRGAAGGGAGG